MHREAIRLVIGSVKSIEEREKPSWLILFNHLVYQIHADNKLDC